MAGHPVRRDGSRGARELEPPDRFGPSSPRDDVEIWVESPGGQDDVDRPLVRVHRGNQASGTFDPRLLEEVLAGCVAFDVKASLSAQASDRFLGLVDDRIRDLVVLELGDDLSPDSPVAAEDEVVAEVVQAALQLPLSPVIAKRVVGEGFGEYSESIEHGSHAGDDERRGEEG